MSIGHSAAGPFARYAAIYETKEVNARLNAKTFAVEEIKFTSDATESIELRHAVRMCILLKALRNFYLF